MSDRRTLFTEITTADALPPHYAYSQALVHGNLLYTQGVNPCDPVTAKVVGTTIEEQTERAMRNLSAILAAAGLSTDHVIKTSVHLADLLRDFEGFDRVYSKYFSAPYPARTTVGVTLWHDYLIEIDVVAVYPDGVTPPPQMKPGAAR
jgi:reactive intermediate/imine deaminase